MQRTELVRATLLGLAAMLAACGSTAGPGAPTAAAPVEPHTVPQAVPPAAPPATLPVSPAPEIPMNAALSSITEAVLADAASRTGLERSRLVVERAETVTWSDGSLGCPAPGMMYTQALVPGYRIRVRAGEQLLDYHASSRGHFSLCPPGRAIDPVGDAAI